MTVYLKVCVIPNSKEFRILNFNQWNNELKIYIKAKAEKNLANKELLKQFKKIFKAEIEITKGKKSKHKLVKINKPEKEINTLIQSFIKK